MRPRERPGHGREVSEAGLVDVHGHEREVPAPGGQGADDVHEAHGPRGADDDDPVPVAQLGGGGRPAVAIVGGRARRAQPTHEVVVDAPDVDLHRPSDPPSAEHDVEDATERQARLDLLQSRGIGTEVDDVVEGLAGEGSGVGREGGAQFGAQPLDGGPLGAVRHDGHERARRAQGEERVQAIDGVPRLGHHEHPPARLRSVPLRRGIGALDTGPRLEERHRGRTGTLADRDEEAFVRPGLDDRSARP